MTEALDTKKVAEEVMLTGGEVLQHYGQLRISTLNILHSIALKVRNIAGEIKDEQQFLKIVAELIDAGIRPATGNVVADTAIEYIDGVVAEQFLKLLDKFVLDRFLGKDWFKDMMRKVDEILAHKGKGDEEGGAVA